jgi:murein DD-endopeptidase MepM/ murein hydrolase activator NlpD
MTSTDSVVAAPDQRSVSDFTNPNFHFSLLGPGGAEPQPGPGNQVVPILQRPFAGDFPLENFFDHDLPFEFPIRKFPGGTQPKDHNGYQLTWWGERTTGVDGHFGYDWLMPEGTPLVAAAAGTIVFAKEHPVVFGCPPAATREPGRSIILEHTAPDGTVYHVEYDHLSRIDVSEGQFVKPGDRIGLSGNAGCTTGPHLHLSVDRKIEPRKFVRVDPYGWEGPGPDPWAQHPDGTHSTWLWKDAAPALRRQYRVQPNVDATAKAPVAITAIQWMGWRDDQHPNNEWVELTLDPRVAALGRFDLTGYRLCNNRGDTFQFPGGFMLLKDRPIYVFAGSGEQTETELYWSHPPTWDHMGDCVRLVKPDGQYMYRLNYSRAGWTGGSKSCY